MALRAASLYSIYRGIERLWLDEQCRLVVLPCRQLFLRSSVFTEEMSPMTIAVSWNMALSNELRGLKAAFRERVDAMRAMGQL